MATDLAPTRVDTRARPEPAADALADLNPRQRDFVLAYVQGHGVAKAAELAGYACPHKKGSRVLAHPNVRRAIESVAEQAAMGASETLLRLSEIAAFDPASVAGKLYATAPDGRRIVDWQKVEEFGVGRFIQRVGMHGKSGHEQIYWYSRFDALSLLAKVHGLTGPDAQVNVDIGRLSIQELKAIVNGA